MAALIHSKEARHTFRNKYKRKSRFRKLRDDNRILFNDNALLKKEVQIIRKEFESLTSRFFYRKIMIL